MKIYPNIMHNKKFLVLSIIIFLLIALAVSCLHCFFNYIFPPGTHHHIQTISVRSTMKARLIEINVKNGTIVKKGMILARLDSTKLRSELATEQNNFSTIQRKLVAAKQSNSISKITQTEKALDLATVNLINAQKNYSNANNLFLHNYISKRKFTVAKNNLATAQSVHHTAEEAYILVTAGSRPADVLYYEKQLTDTTILMQKINKKIAETVIRAPSNGTVTTILVKTGHITIPGENLFNISLNMSSSSSPARSNRAKFICSIKDLISLL
ncbi:HlyD family secretion protein [Pectinatus sottacetonis]|uniref:HlyD family secretion protein n=1 Tax=Pectinatus sottacetonis TaxID=1002795 RepID=UPI001E3EB14F|nr:biotin/lipoyl-binding protein [Pectinatus sottacetonis]